MTEKIVAGVFVRGPVCWRKGGRPQCCHKKRGNHLTAACVRGMVVGMDRVTIEEYFVAAGALH